MPGHASMYPAGRLPSSSEVIKRGSHRPHTRISLFLGGYNAISLSNMIEYEVFMFRVFLLGSIVFLFLLLNHRRFCGLGRHYEILFLPVEIGDDFGVFRPSRRGPWRDGTSL